MSKSMRNIKVHQNRRRKRRSNPFLKFIGFMFALAVAAGAGYFAYTRWLAPDNTVPSDPIRNALTRVKFDQYQAYYPMDGVTSEALPFFSYGYYVPDNLDRYVAYQKDSASRTPDQVIMQVNCGLDYPFYADAVPAKNTNTITMLVNKYYYLPKDYAPADITDIPAQYESTANGQQQLKKEACDAFVKLCQAAGKDGLSILATSTYRTYDRQQSLYEGYIQTNGQAAADTFSAKPGFSEHQTGLAADVQSGSTPFTSFGDTKEYQWVLKNAYKYGFIVRYPQGMDSITGYMPEPWHLRYVGIDTAARVYVSGLTFDEYSAKALGAAYVTN